jgi:hypothetical protein
MAFVWLMGGRKNDSGKSRATDDSVRLHHFARNFAFVNLRVQNLWEKIVERGGRTENFLKNLTQN